MRLLLIVVLAAGCAEHGSSPADAFVPDVKLFADAPVTRCASPSGSADIMTTQANFRSVYAGGILLALFSDAVAPARAAGVPISMAVLATNVTEADGFAMESCTMNPAGCQVEGIVIYAGLEPGVELGTHQAQFRRAGTESTALDGSITVTEFVDPFTDQPGHITATVSGVSPTTSVSGSFSTAFCPPMLTVTI